jgi:hypothetical protein
MKLTTPKIDPDAGASFMPILVVILVIVSACAIGLVVGSAGLF